MYYLRRRVPDDLRKIIGKTVIRRSLNTRHPRQAKAAFALAYAESERLFSDARQGLYVEPCKPETVGPPLPTPSTSPDATSAYHSKGQTACRVRAVRGYRP
ncbi:DUF6538 domain-containing protein [Pseudomonas fulva]|uniref:DUF6538 domain-containing protein n=1 Tax=Pseudomonas fulva TaxID=47880 RepID=UPI003AF11097